MANFKDFSALSFQQIKMKYEDPSLPADTQSLSGFWKSQVVWSLFTRRFSKMCPSNIRLPSANNVVGNLEFMKHRS